MCTVRGGSCGERETSKAEEDMAAKDHAREELGSRAGSWEIVGW